MIIEEAHIGHRHESVAIPVDTGSANPGEMPRRNLARLALVPDTSPARRALGAVVADIEEPPRARWMGVTKRAIDILGSGLGLLLLSPVFLLLALAIKFTSRGPVFFVQERCGLKGRRFQFYKLRTMVVDAEARKPELEPLNEVQGPAFKMRRDPRTTYLGRGLRKLSLDELPQLLNVFKGDMSLVGPRPPTRDEVERYTPRQAQRLAVVPGITGLWQVSGRNDIPDFERWIDLDLEYVQTWSPSLDTRILLKTVLVVLLARGAQ